MTRQTKNLWGWAFAAVIMGICLSALGTTRPKLPPQGVVPDEVTAVRLAEAVFPQAFSAEEIVKWEPYHAQLDKSAVWTVYGALPKGSRGGTPMLRIRKLDGRVLEVWHSM
jgi:hypothetical protein